MQQRKRAKLKLRDSCDSCSDAKIKCNKEKPVCSRCKVKGLTCYYGPSNRSGRRSNDASKASDRSRKSKSPTLELAPAPAQVDASASQAVSSSNEMDSTAVLNAISNADFDFSIDAFDLPDIALDGAGSENTPFTMFPELMKTDLSVPEYDVAAFMSSNIHPVKESSRKRSIDDSIKSSSNDILMYDGRNDIISREIDNMTYDPQWFNNPDLVFQNNFPSGQGMPLSSCCTPQMTLPDISPPPSLQSSVLNQTPSHLPNTNAIFGISPPRASCTCLAQALNLLAALHGNTNASSSTCSSPPFISPKTPPYHDNNHTASLQTLISGGSSTGMNNMTTTIHESLTLNTTSLQQATTILNCECTSQNQQLIFFVAFIALKTMDRYTAAAQAADTLDRDSGSDDKDSSRALAQVVLGELHRVVRIVDTLSKRILEAQGRHSGGNSCSVSSSQIGGDGPQGAPGGYNISASCFAQLENDLRKHLKALTNNTMAVLRRE